MEECKAKLKSWSTKEFGSREAMLKWLMHKLQEIKQNGGQYEEQNEIRQLEL